jgi:hypothetical protein
MRRREDPAVPRSFAAAGGLLLLCVCAAQAGADAETIGGHDEPWWRSQARFHERAVERVELELSACEEREAPPAYDRVPGQVFRGRDGLRYREVLRCDEQRTELERAREALDAFEDLAHRLEVPPGWLR